MYDYLWWHCYSATINEENNSYIHCVVIYAECSIPPTRMPTVVEEEVPSFPDPECPESLRRHFGEKMYMTYEHSFDHKPTEEQTNRLLPEAFQQQLREGRAELVNITQRPGADPSLN